MSDTAMINDDSKDSEKPETGNQAPAISNHQAAAILMLLFSEEQAADILSRLEPEEVSLLSETMYSVADIGAGHINQVLDLFIESAANRTTVGYRADQQIESMLKKALGEQRAETMIKRVAPKKSSNNLDTLKWMDTVEIAVMIENEHPQICALVLSFVKPEIAAQVIELLPEVVQDDVIYRLATLGPVSNQAIETVENLLASQGASGGLGGSTPSGGTSEAAAILNNFSKAKGQKLIKLLAKRNKDVARMIEDEMFVFADLAHLSPKDLGTLMRSVEGDVLVPALKGADEDMRGKIFASMSSRAAQSVQDEMEDRGPMPMSEVIAAQKEIIAMARRLSDSGEIIIGGQGDDYV